MYLKIFKKAFGIIFGIILVVLGIIGLFLPIAPGILLIIAGLFLLGVKKDQMKEFFRKIKKYFFG